MAVIARPDLIGALLSRLRGIPEVTSLVSSASGWTDQRTEPRISGTRQDRWALPTRAVVLRRTGGPPDAGDYALGIWRSRVDVICYGQDERLASGLIDVVLPALVPLQGDAAGFTVGPCRVGSVEPESEIIVERAPETGYPYAWCPVIVRWLGVPV